MHSAFASFTSMSRIHWVLYHYSVSVYAAKITLYTYTFSCFCLRMSCPTCAHYWTAPLLSKVVMLYFYGRCKVSCLFVAVNVVNRSVCTLIAVIYWWKLVFFDNPNISLMSRSKIRIFFQQRLWRTWIHICQKIKFIPCNVTLEVQLGHQGKFQFQHCCTHSKRNHI